MDMLHTGVCVSSSFCPPVVMALLPSESKCITFLLLLRDDDCVVDELAVVVVVAMPPPDC